MAVIVSYPQWSPWPRALLSGVSILVFVAGLVAAWKSADRVVPENRRWTRSWRIFVVVAFGFSLGGVPIPFGAIYALVKYRRPSRPRHLAQA